MNLFDVLILSIFFFAVVTIIDAVLGRFEYFYKRTHYDFKHPYFSAHEKEINDLVKEQVEHELNSGEFIAPPTTTTKKAGK